MGEERMDSKSEVVELILPWPPTVNHYWRRSGDRFYVSREGIYYRVAVCKVAGQYAGLFESDDKIKIRIQAFPPDNRRRDLDNVLKSLLDSLQHSEIYDDDYQIYDLHISRNEPNDGKLIVHLSAL